MNLPVAPHSAPALREIPRRSSWPVVGDSFSWLRDADGFLKFLHGRYGDAVRIHAFGTHQNLLLGPDANQLVFQNRGDLFASARWEYFIGPFFRRGLMLLDFEEHRMHRRIMQSAFAHDALVGYLQGMQRRVEQDLRAWQPGAGFLVFDHLKLLTLNVGSEVFVGQAPSAQTSAMTMNRAFLATVRAGTGVVRFALPGTRWHAGIAGRAVLERFFYGELPAKRAAPGTDLFSRLCQAKTENGELFSDEDVVNHIIFVLMAAHDTSTITLTNMIYHLARQPAWQDRLREESRALGKTDLAVDDLERLEGMSLAMKEALRICPPVPMMPRAATRECEYKGMRIPAGAAVTISPWLTHRLPQWWRDPESFDPERFSPARAEDKQHPFLWVPFGGGAHKCIGLHFGQMEVKIILHRMLLRFRWSVPDGYVMAQDFTALPIPKDRLPVHLERLH